MSWLGMYSLVEWLIRVGMVIAVLRRRLEPTTALAWLAVTFLQPIVGLVFYLLIGGHRLGRRRVRLHSRAIRAVRESDPLAEHKPHVTRPQVDPALAPLILQAEAISGMPILSGNGVELMHDSRQTIDRIIADVDAAEHHVHMLFYIFANDATGRRVAEALVRAVERGVQCRVLADDAGSRALFAPRWRRHKSLASWMIDRGVELHPALPVRLLRRKLARLDLRNHRKIVVIDGRTGYAGSQNIVDATWGSRRIDTWLDLTGRFTGPIVAQLQIVFLEDWNFETDQWLDTPDILPAPRPAGEVPAQVVATGPGHESEALPRVLLAAISAAQRKVIITSPYLVLDEPTYLALAMAVDRGVEVRLVLPQRSDHPLVDAAGRAHYQRLLEAGVKIHLHRTASLHAKTMSVDDAFALLGSSNMDVRSFYLNFEVNVLLYGEQVTHELRFAQMSYLNDSDELTLEVWLQRPILRRYLNAAAALLSPLL